MTQECVTPGQAGAVVTTSQVPANKPTKPRLRASLLLMLALITAFAPLSLDLYLPGLPDLRTDLGGSVQIAQLTVTACIFGLAFGQFLAGVLTDALGRRLPLMIGMVIWTGTTLACAAVPSIKVLVALRLLQGLTAGVGMATAPAIISDVDPRHLTRHLSRMFLIIAVVPVLAPSLGGVMLRLTTWRGIFVVLAIVGALLTVVVALFLPESLPPGERTSLDLRRAGGAYRSLLTDRDFIVPAAMLGCSFGVLFTYISGSPFVFRDFYGLGPMPYGLLFGGNAAGLILGMQLSPILVERFGSRRILQVSATAGATSAVALLICSRVPTAGLTGIIIALFLMLAATGLSIPAASGAAIGSRPEASGSAAGLLGTIQFTCGGAIGALSSAADPALGVGPLAVTAIACFLVGLIVAEAGRRPPSSPIEAYWSAD
jgi:DHA1 family bicyclomycin/chloramphenicol resistance-like MFS transporter